MGSRILIHNLGYPRMGALRQLKKSLEAYWRGIETEADLHRTAAGLRRLHWLQQKEAGVDLIPSNDFSFYDHVLDTAAMVGAVPETLRLEKRARGSAHLLRDGAGQRVGPRVRRRMRLRPRGGACDGDDEVVSIRITTTSSPNFAGTKNSRSPRRRRSTSSTKAWNARHQDQAGFPRPADFSQARQDSRRRLRPLFAPPRSRRGLR